MARFVTELRLEELEDLIRRVVREELEQLRAEKVVYLDDDSSLYQDMLEAKRQKEAGDLRVLSLKRLLRLLAAYADWETLPPHLQDAVDTMLVEESLAEGGQPRSLREVLEELGGLPEMR